MVLDVNVQTRINREALSLRLGNAVRYRAVGPSTNTAFGGLTATHVFGKNGVRYGTRGRTSTIGQGVTRLLVSPNGILGGVNELTIRLHSRPETVSATVVPFADASAAAQAVSLRYRTSASKCRAPITLGGMPQGAVRGDGTAHKRSPLAKCIAAAAGPPRRHCYRPRFSTVSATATIRPRSRQPCSSMLKPFAVPE